MRDTIPETSPLPTNTEAEQAFLGAALQRNSVAESVLGRLKPEHFSVQFHAAIFAAIEKALGAGMTANAITLASELSGDPGFALHGGRAYLVRLQGSVVSPLHAKDYAETVIQCWQRRRIIEISDGARALAGLPEAGVGVPDILRETEDALYAVADGVAVGSGLSSGGTASSMALRRAETAFKNGGLSDAVQTGLHDLDRRIGGLFPGELTVLAGRPSMGKTALAGTIIRHVAKRFAREAQEGGQSRAVYFHSAEQPTAEIAHRDLADLSGVSAERQRRGSLSNEDFNSLIDASASIAEWPYFIDDTAQVGLAYLRHRARRIARRHGLGLIVVDHLQKLRLPVSENRRLEIGEITGGLAALAKELRVPVLLLSQLSRAVEQRDDKRPQLSDLRESGDIEQDADVVCFLYREAYYLERDRPQQREDEKDEHFADRTEHWRRRRDAVANAAELIIAKVRQGRTGQVALVFNGERSRFESVAQPSMMDGQP